MGRNTRIPAKCHPDKLHIAHGLCSECYSSSHYIKNKIRILTKNHAWVSSNTERHKVLKRRGKLARYGLTEEQYDTMLAAQGGVCAICKEPPRKRRLSVDHDHSTERVRALLCTTCNKLRMGMNTLETAKIVVQLLESTFDGRFISSPTKEVSSETSSG